MPELPEVESVVCALRESSLIGRTLSVIETICPKIPDLSCLIGQKIQAISRRGKYIHFQLSTVHLIVHLRMTGQFLLKRESKHLRVIFYFEDLVLAFHDTRRFATFDLSHDPKQFFSRLGPEPFDTFFDFSKWSKVIKAVLLDQSIIAGIGNIYADEALWEAGIHPERPACEINQQENHQLLEAVRKVLSQGIKQGGTSLGTAAPNFHHLNGHSGSNQNTLQVYGREGESCLRCGHSIEKITLQQRGTHFCPDCQK